MKMCVTATDLSEHYQNEHDGRETRRREFRELPAVTVGFVYLASVLGYGLLVTNVLLFLSRFGVGLFSFP